MKSVEYMPEYFRTSGEIIHLVNLCDNITTIILARHFCKDEKEILKLIEHFKGIGFDKKISLLKKLSFLDKKRAESITKFKNIRNMFCHSILDEAKSIENTDFLFFNTISMITDSEEVKRNNIYNRKEHHKNMLELMELHKWLHSFISK